MKKGVLLFPIIVLVVAINCQIAVAADKDKPTGLPDFENYDKADPSAFRAAKLYFITNRGGFALTSSGGHAVYEFGQIGYDTNWSFVGQNSNWFIFKEQGFAFWMAFERSSPYSIRWNNTGTGNGTAFVPSSRVYEEN